MLSINYLDFLVVLEAVLLAGFLATVLVEVLEVVDFLALAFAGAFTTGSLTSVLATVFFQQFL